MLKVVGVGDNVIDRYMHKGMMYPGGNSVNFAVYAAQLGYQAAYVGVIADDKEAKVITDALNACGIDSSHCQHVRGETGLSTTTVDEQGDRTITDNNEYGAVKSTPLQLNTQRLDFIAGFDIAHSSCYSFIEDQLHLIKERCVSLVYDFSDQWDESEFERVCPNINIAFFSGKKLAKKELVKALQKTLDLGCQLAITTIGKSGALISNGRKVYSSAPYNLDAVVVDTLGAGDSFLTGFLTTYFNGLKQFESLAGPQNTTENDFDRFEDALIEYSMQVGNLLAIKNCMYFGAFGLGVPM
jgi:sugar/nucleoside kinase (ribokinase family)